jgi:hypothetical protein
MYKITYSGQAFTSGEGSTRNCMKVSWNPEQLRHLVHGRLGGGQSRGQAFLFHLKNQENGQPREKGSRQCE